MTSPATPERTTLKEIVRTATVGALSAYGVSSHPAQPGSDLGAELAFAGIIGFTGASLRGTLLITTTGSMLDRSNPITGSARDWIAEFANQLLGRIKNQLLRHGVEIYMTTPLVLRGQHLSPESLRTVDSIELDTNGGPIFVSLESETTGELVLERDPQAFVGSEGDAILF